jgi:hypothetical protein
MERRTNTNTGQTDTTDIIMLETNLAGSEQWPLSNIILWLGLTKGCHLIQNLAGSTKGRRHNLHNLVGSEL